MYSPSRSEGPDSAFPDIQVQVQSRYLPEHSTPERHLFVYVIRIENRSDLTWQLLARHWDIMDATGRVTRVDGEGVVGEQPVLAPGGTFVYDSFVTLDAAPGHMGGHYVMQDAWGSQVQVPVPAFALSLPGRTLN
ncbi:Co2+/Mg2+ efflux protein ApaG [Deinococcus depolymerans]|uniref:Co2+/Mg2+ efflux protein ApaG n=1 Tax=Deinococcus depolymerans TaxID=392408 RepID=A0ABN1CG15_9DEIO